MTNEETERRLTETDKIDDVLRKKEETERRLAEMDKICDALRKKYEKIYDEQQYTLSDVMMEVYQKRMRIPEEQENTEIPDSNVKDMRRHFLEFFTLMKLPTEKLRSDGKYHFTRRNKDFLVWLLSGFTENPIKKFRNGKIDIDEFGDFRKMVQGAEDILTDAQLSKNEFEEARKNFYEHVNYSGILREVILNKITEILKKEFAMSNNDKTVWLEWVYDRFLDTILYVAEEMADIRRAELDAGSMYLEESAYQTNVEGSFEVTVEKYLEQDEAYRALKEEKQLLENPTGKSGSRNLAIRNTRLENIKEKMEYIRKQAKDTIKENFDLGEVDENGDAELEKRYRKKMISSEEVLRRAIENTNKQLL